MISVFAWVSWMGFFRVSLFWLMLSVTVVRVVFGFGLMLCCLCIWLSFVCFAIITLVIYRFGWMYLGVDCGLCF